MSELDPSAWKGNYIPFRVPFFVNEDPPALPGDPPLVALCMNEEYVPYVQGAIKALTREESYRGSAACIQVWTQAFMDLLLQFECDAQTALPDMDWEFLTTQSHASAWTHSTPELGSPEWPKVTDQTESFLAFNEDPGVEELAIYETAEDLVTFVAVGFRCYDFEIYTDNGAADITVQWQKTDGTSGSVTVTGSGDFGDAFGAASSVDLRYIRFLCTDGALLYGFVAATGRSQPYS